ncbi:sodium:proton antiporter [Shewanella cyperi]|uniref:Sodium:proton antiporter n=1 Tax=Shewanella cyperi TaxID=2814292 RepID=A0A974XK16_9GAMM|nr:Na+/H+ antiporter NhaC family protein [Shewanella cyperi]QSX29824.1 sodium:proton antiporter [Shewanella cyperi]
MDISATHLLPLLLTLILALVLRRTLLALGIGVLASAAMLSDYAPLATLAYLGDSLGGQFYLDGWQSWHLNVLAAMMLLGVMTELLARGGAVAAFGHWLERRIRDGRSARLGIMLLGWLVFIDGIFSCLAVGHISRPIAERYGLPKGQAAYLVDASASPLCSLVPFSSWGPYVMALLAAISFLPLPPLAAFLEIARHNLYAICTLVLLALVAWGNWGWPEAQARPTDGELRRGSPWQLLLPLLTLLTAAVILTLYSGAQQGGGLAQWLANADIGTAMRDAALLACLVALLLSAVGGRKVGQLLGDLLHGLRNISLAIAILLLTWMTGKAIADLGVAKLLAETAELWLSPRFLLPGIFVLCALMAFATGTSWGTFAIMIPICAEIAHSLAPELLLPALSAVMAGSVFGDHCSPISDTSILSATASGCEVQQHVLTQLPFAMMAALASLGGYVLFNLGLGYGWGLLLALGLLPVMLALLRRLTRPNYRVIGQ